MHPWTAASGQGKVEEERLTSKVATRLTNLLVTATQTYVKSQKRIANNKLERATHGSRRLLQLIGFRKASRGVRRCHIRQ